MTEPSLQIDLVASEKAAVEAAVDLAGELAEMHGVLFNLITALYHSRHSNVQDRLLNKAFAELKASQLKFMEKYADQTLDLSSSRRFGGAAPSTSSGQAPERN